MKAKYKSGTYIKTVQVIETSPPIPEGTKGIVLKAIESRGRTPARYYVAFEGFVNKRYVDEVAINQVYC